MGGVEYVVDIGLGLAVSDQIEAHSPSLGSADGHGCLTALATLGNQCPTRLQS